MSKRRGNGVPAVIEATPLSTEESADLKRHEATIDKGLGTFLEVGNALLAISEGHLYRADYPTFDAYCRERFSVTRNRAYQLIEAARISRDLPTIVGKPDSDVAIPSSEGQIRPLKGLPAEQRREAWSKAVHDSPNGKPTAKDVKRAAAEVTGKPDRKATPKPKAAAKPLEPSPNPDPKGVDAVLSDDESEDDGQDADERAAIRAEGNGSKSKARPKAEPSEDDRTDAEWLESLPARSAIASGCRRIFDRDALKYRTISTCNEYEPFRRRVKSVLDEKTVGGGMNGPYHAKLSAFLRIPHPRDWKTCPPTDKGGCGGKGIIGTTGNCAKCFGRGFLIV